MPLKDFSLRVTNVFEVRDLHFFIQTWKRLRNRLLFNFVLLRHLLVSYNNIYFYERLNINHFSRKIVNFTIVVLNWYDLKSYSIVLPISISVLVCRLWTICFRFIIYARFTLYFCERFSYNYWKLYFCSFTVVFLTWSDVTSYSILLPVSISALVFRLWSIWFRFINEGYFGYFIGMKVYRVCTSFD